MDRAEPMTLEEIIARARALPVEQRRAFVERCCAGDDALAASVLGWLDHEPQPAVPSRDPPSARAAVLADGDRVGPYRLLRSLGRGGMGEVFLAERADREFRQQVAIKLVASGRVHPGVQARLRNERQILATLSHPNIARLLDGGTLADGTPYIVMEYIAGEPIDVYCDVRSLDVDARLALFRTVCLAVHAAHQNLVVHRDLKPSNILVEADGTPKLLDFGIAKLLDTRDALHTLAVTHADLRMMTPDHASPEQVRGGPITTASDIYVLGVLLHELLTGSRPFEIATVRLRDIERAICEQPPIAPSAAVSRLLERDAGLAARIADCRSTSAQRLRRRLAGDLDNIVGMAMRKEPERRFGSAEQLAADVARHLAGQPVIARPDTRRYRTAKFIARHRLGVAAGVTGALMLSGFAVAMYVQAERVARERDSAAAERSRAEQVSTFLVDLFELSDPLRARSSEVTARELLDAGARRITAGLEDQPQTRALLLGTIGRVYGNLGVQDRAVALLEQAVELERRLNGDADPRVATALRALGDNLVESGEYDAAQPRLEEALRIETAAGDFPSAGIALTRQSLGRLAQQRGDLAAAESQFRAAIAIHTSLGLTSESVHASLLNDLAGVLTHGGRYAEAAALYQRAIEIDTAALGADHPQVAQHVHSLAVVRQLQGDFAAAAPLYERSVLLLERVLGESHPLTIDALGNYGRFLQARGDLDAAERTLRRTLSLDTAARGESHPFVGYDLVNLALLLHEQGRDAEAEPLYIRALAIYGATLPADHLYVASARVGLGRTLAALGRTDEAQEEIEQGLAISSARLPPDHPQVAGARAALLAARAAAR